MSLTPGTRLGPYEVTAQIGEGGMGEVYQATDTNLKRSVAIKVLPASVAGDADRLARFQREAEVLAALNHPNIAQIHGLEKSAGTIALVMELVEGPTLADRIAQGAIPVDEALPIAKQIAEALEAAHEQGIIHRDLKPANVKVRPDGTVKVLDFGLAKALEPASAMSPGMSQAPTITTPAMTQAGMILGTAAYMSPEQAKGRSVDKRSDVWAFGAVLYEMLSGKRAFDGEDMTDVLGAVVRLEPDWDVLPLDTPPAVLMFLKRCLRKDPKQRIRDIGDVSLALEGAFETGASLTAASVLLPQPAVWRRPVPVALAASLLTAVVIGLTVWTVRTPGTTGPVARLSLALPADQQFAGLGRMSPVALSPDGSSVAYVAIRDGNRQLYVRTLDSREARPLPGTEGAEGPFFSPDGLSLGFFAGAELKRVSIAGGRPTALARATDNSSGGSWGSDGFILFASAGGSRGLQRVSASGGEPEAVTTPDVDGGEGLHRFPQYLPGGNAILFTIGTGGSWDDALIVAERLDTGERKVLIEGGSDARYVPTGHLVFNREGGLRVAPFDVDGLEVTGDSVAVIEGVMQSIQVTGAAFVGLSELGGLIYLPGAFQATDRTVVWVDRQGLSEPVPVPSQPYVHVSLSLDGRRMAVDIDEGTEQQIWVHDVSRPGSLTKVTVEGTNNQAPRFTPDGRRISFASGSLGSSSSTIFSMSADGGGAVDPVLTRERSTFLRSWSADGRFLAFDSESPDADFDIMFTTLDGEPEILPFLDSEFSERSPRFSPDGHWLTYYSDESGRGEIYVRSFPDAEQRRQISTGGSGTGSAWTRDGRELFYLSRNRMMAVDIQTSPELAVGPPRELFEAPFPVFPEFDVSANGERFLMIQVGDQAEGELIHIVQNWFEELRRLVPTD